MIWLRVAIDSSLFVVVSDSLFKSKILTSKRPNTEWSVFKVLLGSISGLESFCTVWVQNSNDFKKNWLLETTKNNFHIILLLLEIFLPANSPVWWSYEKKKTFSNPKIPFVTELFLHSFSFMLFWFPTDFSSAKCAIWYRKRRMKHPKQDATFNFEKFLY